MRNAGGSDELRGLPIIDNFRRDATYVDKIVKGDGSSSIAVRAAHQVFMVINGENRQDLGLHGSPSFWTGDRVVE
jgi:hypothetical protein